MPNLTVLHIPAHSVDEEELDTMPDAAARSQHRLRIAFVALASLNIFMLSGAACLVVLSYLRY